MDLLNLNSYLKFGFYLDYRAEIQPDLSRLDPSRTAGAGDEELLGSLRETFRAAVARLFRTGKDHVVPLSGGLDSRAVLAALLEFTPASRLETYTFGTPGTLDFEIGNRIAREVGTRHSVFPMDPSAYRLPEWIEVSRRIHHQTRLFETPPILEIQARYGDCPTWSGVAGCIAAGSYVPPEPHTDLETARAFFVKELTHVESIELSGCEPSAFHPRLGLASPVDPRCLSFYEQLLLEHEIPKLIAPHMLFEGPEHLCPFLDPELLGFMLGLDASQRRQQALYRGFLLTTYPALFALPSKSNENLPLEASGVRYFAGKLGRKLRQLVNVPYPLLLDRNANYVDFERALATRDDFRKLLYECLMDLEARRLVDWIDIGRLWRSRRFWRKRHLPALLLLASLEIHLKAGKQL